tara:strand:- start:118 stop:360 length:243 start_codon:yes stop_codon:yes gene_type:complete
MTSDPTLRIGDQAKKILEEESVRTAFDSLKSSLVHQWITAESDTLREKCWHSYHAVSNLQNELHAQVQRAIRKRKQTKED